MAEGLGDLSDEQLTAGIAEQGSQQAFGKTLGVSKDAVRRELRRRGLTRVPQRRRGVVPKLTRESLHRALEPPNNCKVKTFLDSLDAESRGVVEEGLGYPKADFPAAALRDWLIAEGFDPVEVPGSDPINDHRAGRRPCRCRG